MGEKIKDISNIDLDSFKFTIELNDGSAASKKPLHIHLQNERFRLDIPDSEFLQMAVAIRTAGKIIEATKNLEDI